MSHTFYFSAKAARQQSPHRTFVTVDGREIEYTEWCENHPPKSKWPDLMLVATVEDNPQIRVENAPPAIEFGWPGLRGGNR